MIAYDLQLDGLSVQVDAADFLTPPANFRFSATFVTHTKSGTLRMALTKSTPIVLM